MKKVHGGILICDVLFATAAIFSAVIDVLLSIEMTDADTQRIKIANHVDFGARMRLRKRRLQDLKKNSSLILNVMV